MKPGIFRSYLHFSAFVVCNLAFYSLLGVLVFNVCSAPGGSPPAETVTETAGGILR